MRERKVVITGAGLVTPLGNSVSESWEKMKAMKTGIGHYPKDDAPAFLQYLGKVNGFEVSEDIPHKLLSQMKFLNRGSLLGFGAAVEAQKSSGLDLSVIPPERRSLYIASGDFTKVGYDFMYPATKDGTSGKWEEMDFEKLNKSTIDKVNPFFLLESIYNNLFSFLSAFFEFMGPSTSLASLSPCGGQALEMACRSIRQGKADIAMAVGCGNWITEIPLYEVEGLGLLSKCKKGMNSFRPFDRERDGFIAGEGGAALFLESLESAEARGADILGRIRGVGDCIEFSQGQGLSIARDVTKRSMKMALEEAESSIDEIAFVIPHGSGTQKGDGSELGSVKALLNGNEATVPVCGLKPYTGHMGAASDIAEIIFGIKAVKEKVVPATLNFNKTDNEFSGLKISGSQQECRNSQFLSVSYGIGGQSSSVVVSAA
ncbi:MAG: beta-ketoacyl synthase N-terminal-like domain-containing protein [Nitrospirota bacterium]